MVAVIESYVASPYSSVVATLVKLVAIKGQLYSKKDNQSQHLQMMDNIPSFITIVEQTDKYNPKGYRK
jgi:hypothetical protein